MLTAWYIDNDPNTGHVRNNYYPRNEVANLIHTGITRPDLHWFGHYTLEPNVLYKDTDPIVFKKIHSSDPLPQENNIFLFQLDNIGDEIFQYDVLNPINTLPEDILDWLRNFQFVRIVFFDAKEFNNVHLPELATIPSIHVQRNKHRLFNDVLYLNCGSNIEELVKDSNFIPPWLTFLGSPSYPQLNYSYLCHVRFNEGIYKHRPGDPKFLTYTYPVEKYLDISKVTKTFLMYVGRARYGRVILASKILENISDENILYRVNRPGHKVNEPLALLDSENFWWLSEEQRNRYNDLISIAPIGNIEANASNYESELWFLFPQPETYETIFLDIVHETFSDCNLHEGIPMTGDGYSKIFITEKIFKPLITLKPFVVNANPGYLSYLRNLGFKTFNKFWSEEYDNETDFDKKTDMIVNILTDLNQKSNKELEELHQEMKPILLHNRQKAEEFLYGESVWVRRLINYFEGRSGFKKVMLI